MAMLVCYNHGRLGVSNLLLLWDGSWDREQVGSRYWKADEDLAGW
jgi:hypothetical protein